MEVVKMSANEILIVIIIIAIAYNVVFRGKQK